MIEDLYNFSCEASLIEKRRREVSMGLRHLELGATDGAGRSANGTVGVTTTRSHVKSWLKSESRVFEITYTCPKEFV